MGWGRRRLVARGTLTSQPCVRRGGEACRFETASAQAQFLESFAEEHGVGFSGASGGILLFTAVDQAVEERAGGDDDGLGADGAAVAERDSDDAAALSG